MFLARYIEKVGTGTLDMIARSKEAGLLPPTFRQSGGQVVQVLWRPTPQVTPQVESLITNVLEGLQAALGAPTPQVTPQVATQVARMLEAAGEQPSKSVVLQKAIGLKDLEHFRRRFRTPLVKAQWLAMSDPNSPNSPQQLYALAPKGKEWLDRFNTLPKP